MLDKTSVKARLGGKNILVGREPEQGRLAVAVTGQPKIATIGMPGSVPTGVSRCIPAQNKAHVMISVGVDGSMTATNMKPQNQTLVNGLSIVSKHVEPESMLEMGAERFRVPLKAVIEAAMKIVPETYSIRHLEKVWEDYLAAQKELRDKQKRVNLIRTGCGMFTMCAMPCIYFFGPVGYVLTAIGIIGNLYSFIGLKNDDTPERMREINEDFQERYVCPNPKDGRFLGNQSYRMLKKSTGMKCPYCHAQFTE